MKGHMENGKFHPHTEYKKGTRKSRDQQVKTQGVKIRKQRINPECKYGDCIAKGKDINEFCSSCLAFANKNMRQSDLDNIRKERVLLNEIPDDYDWETHGEHPQQFTDEAYRKHTEKHRAIANRLNVEIQGELPMIIQTVENLKGFHEDAVRDADDLIRSLRNKNHTGSDTLPLEYMDLTNTEIDNFIRDWSNVGHSGEQFNREQNQAIAKDLEDLRNFQNKVENYHHSHGMVS